MLLTKSPTFSVKNACAIKVNIAADNPKKLTGTPICNTYQKKVMLVTSCSATAGKGWAQLKGGRELDQLKPCQVGFMGWTKITTKGKGWLNVACIKTYTHM